MAGAPFCEKHGDFVTCLTFAVYLLATSYFYTVSTIPELEGAGRLPLWLVEVADKDSFADDHLNHVYYACFLAICVYNLAFSHIDVS